ncbi:MAG: hypothetical protein HC880_13165 [Bacteroidia bacterium]|nr:hypothetical protein [Bacteroidia bacterium]
MRQYPTAEIHIKEAIRLEPEEADYFGVWSFLYIQRRNWQQALQYARQGLSIDPENIDCLNYQTQCLLKLGRYQALEDNVLTTLAKDPENAYSHAVVGWARLEKGKHRQAKEHFGEALRLNPHLDFARQGMIESLKASNAFYRLFLNYFFWISKFQSQSQWGIIIGIYLLMSVVRRSAREFPILVPLVVILSLMIYLTWIIHPLFNLVLRLDKHSRHMLSPDETRGAHAVGLGLGAAILSVGLAFGLGLSDFLGLALLSATIIIPISTYYEIAPHKRKWVGIYTLILLILGGLSVASYWIAPQFNLAAGLYLVGIWTFGWVANYLIINKP